MIRTVPAARPTAIHERTDTDDAARHRRVHLRRPVRARPAARPPRPVLPARGRGRSRRSGRSGTPIAPRPTTPRRRSSVSDLIVRMAPHVSRFVARCSSVDERRRRVARATRTSSTPLFRFKIDFVRKRALPLVKGGAHVRARPGRRGRRRRAGASVRAPRSRARDRRGRLRAARSRGRARADGHATTRRPTIAATVDALKRWCAVVPARPGATGRG